MNANVLTHLSNEPGLVFILHATASPLPELRWYAAFRDPDSDELTPERGYGEGATAEEATRVAVEDFRSAEDRAAR